MEFIDKETGEVVNLYPPIKRRKKLHNDIRVSRAKKKEAAHDELPDGQDPTTGKPERKNPARVAPYAEWMTIGHKSAEYLSLVMNKEIPAQALVFWFRLMALVEQGNKIDYTQTQIGARVGISQQMTSRWIRLFINKGFIYKHGYYYRIPPDFMYCGAWAKIGDAKQNKA
jgi:hypothetical protein